MGRLHLRTVVSAAALTCWLGWNLPAEAATAVVNRVVATVDGEPVTAHELEIFLRQNAPGVDSSRLSDEDRRKALEALINDILVQRESQSLGLSATDKEVTEYIDQIKRQNNLDDQTLQTALTEQGMTMDGYRAHVRKEILKSQVVARQIRQNMKPVTDDEVKAFYEKNRDQFQVTDAVQVRHIFFIVPPDATPADLKKAEGKAIEAMKRLKAGQKFETVARDMSEGPEASDGGSLGVMRKGEMLPEIEEVAFRLPVGQPSPPMRSRAGIHILRVDKREGSQYTSYDDVKGKIKDRLQAQKVEANFQEWAGKELRDGHSVVIRP